jgi:hypothetical protein
MTSRAATDLLLLHAPSVYDFRHRSILYGPVSDMVPSSTVFEMYPLGFLTIASYLHDRGIDVRDSSPASRRGRSESTCTGCRTRTARSRWPASARNCTPACP